MTKLLIIDDDKDITTMLDRFFKRKDFNTVVCNTSKQAYEALEKDVFDVILCDYRLNDIEAPDIINKLKEMNIATPVIVITGYGDIKEAIRIIKLGAYNYVTKPLFPDEILHCVKEALAHDTNAPIEFLKEKAKAVKEDNTHFLVPETPSFKSLLKLIDTIAPTNYSVIIYGESGAGKEAVAQLIHANSLRANKPFIAIDCGALSKEIANSELFGHEKGSFTGAIAQKIGSFELANGGTVFLDEIANLPYDIQVSLLRVVQERKMRRVGGVEDIELDIRIIVASNENLKEATQNGKFRQDLYYRFNEFSIELKPLRERKDDIAFFADSFLDKAKAELKKDIQGFSKEVLHFFNQYNWPGNLRELRNVIIRASLLAKDGEKVDIDHLPEDLIREYKMLSELLVDEVHIEDSDEVATLKQALIEAKFNTSKAAKLLRLTPAGLKKRLSNYPDLAKLIEK